MRRQSRFVSLSGSARKWIAAEDEESVAEDDAAAIATVRRPERMPLRVSRPLARLGDIWSPRGIPFYRRVA
jgi:hypothetical protein